VLLEIIVELFNRYDYLFDCFEMVKLLDREDSGSMV
jgi:hypothetical protein